MHYTNKLIRKLKQTPIKVKELHTNSNLCKDEQRLYELIDGYLTLEDIKSHLELSNEEFFRIYNNLKKKGILSTVFSWNKVLYCTKCNLLTLQDTHEQKSYCLSCSNQLSMVPLSFPCDPLIVKDRQRDFITKFISDKSNFTLPDNELIYINSIWQKHYIWEIFIREHIYGKIHFYGMDKTSWKLETYVDNNDFFLKKNSQSFLAKEERLYKHMIPRLKRLEQEAVSELKQLNQKYKNKPLLMYSGGKDSSVILELATIARLSTFVGYINIGLETQETQEFVENTLNGERYRIHDFVKEISPMQEFVNKGIIDIIKGGYWCDNKKQHLQKSMAKKLYGNNKHACIIGIRRHEQSNRVAWAANPYRECSIVRNQDLYMPIRNWTILDIWFYIKLREIPINPMYINGWERVVCFCCPGGTPYQIELSKEQYSAEWQKIEDKLNEASIDHQDYFRPIMALGNIR